MSLSQNIEVVIALFMIVFLYVNRRIIILSIIRSLFGNYSYEYVSHHKKYYAKNPFPPCIKEDLKMHCFNFIDINTDKPQFDSKSAIGFGSFPFDTEFVKVKGGIIPNCFNIYRLSEKDTIKIIGMKTEILGLETKELYYFMNDKYFMGEYSFSDVSEASNIKLISMLASKYEIDEAYAKESFYVRDDKKALICYENNGFSISIQYINLGNPQINEVWDKYFKNVIRKEIFCSASISGVMLAKL
jgi:hypothetical protein